MPICIVYTVLDIEVPNMQYIIQLWFDICRFRYHNEWLTDSDILNPGSNKYVK